MDLSSPLINLARMSNEVFQCHLTTVTVQAAPKNGIAPKLRTSIIRAVTGSADYASVVASLESKNVAVSVGNSAVEYGGESPDKSPVYTVALGTRGSARDTAKAILAFVEVQKESDPKVLAVGLVEISAPDEDGNRVMEVSGPGRKSVRSTYNAKTGKVLETAVDGMQVRPNHHLSNGFQAETQGACSWICWLAGTVACTAVCVPLGAVTGGVGGFVCGTVCSAVFNWVCGYCP